MRWKHQTITCKPQESERHESNLWRSVKQPRRLNRGYDSTDIVAGSAESQRAVSTSKPALDRIQRSNRAIVDIAKDKVRNVTISSIPPLLDPTYSKNKVASVNAGLLQLCRSPTTPPCLPSATVPQMMATLYFEQDGDHITPSRLPQTYSSRDP